MAYRPIRKAYVKFILSRSTHTPRESFVVREISWRDSIYTHENVLWDTCLKVAESLRKEYKCDSVRWEPLDP